MSAQHSTWVTRHDVSRCNTARHAESGICGTYYETHCSCGFGQGAIYHEHAIAIGRAHRANPTAHVISWESGAPITAVTITDQDLRDLFARHCACHPIDLERGQGDHAAIHDCDTGTCADIQITLGINLFNDIGRVQAIHKARGRCAEIINTAQKGRFVKDCCLG